MKLQNFPDADHMATMQEVETGNEFLDASRGGQRRLTNANLMDVVRKRYTVVEEGIQPEDATNIQLENAKKKFKKKKWITREIAENLGREYVLLATLKDTLFFLIFLILSTIISLGVVESEMYHFYKVMEDELLNQNNFYQTRTAAGVWLFLDSAFKRSFYWDYWYFPDQKIAKTNTQDRHVFYENKLLGVPRLRQLQVRSDTCIIHPYFKQVFTSCYGPFSVANEYTETFGFANGTAWTYTPSDELLDQSYWGKVAWYHGGGYYQDLSLHQGDTLEIIRQLKHGLWITRGTRVVFLDFTFYNSNINVFLQYRLAFEFPQTGGVSATSSTQMTKLLRYVDSWDYFILTCEFFCIAFVIYYTFEEIREIKYFKWDYFNKFWTYVDLTVIGFGYTAVAIRIYGEIEVGRRLDDILSNPAVHNNMQQLIDWMLKYNLLLAVQLFFIYMKVFKYLNFNKSMAQLNKTLSACRKDMIGFAIMFFVIFIAFSILGYLIFGNEVHDFSSFYMAMFTLLRTILGDFDYTDIEKANRILAPIYFLCFIFLVFFILLNMFLAIINDTYVDVKTEMALEPEELRMAGFIKRGYYNVLIKMGLDRYVQIDEYQKNEFEMTMAEIKGALKRIGFSDLEIEMFFARYNIDPNTRVQQMDLQALYDTLEGKTDTMGGKAVKADDDKPLVAIDDFLRQQEKLKKIEETIAETTMTLQTLLDKLEMMDNVRKTKK